MDADWSVELGADDPTLDFPWQQDSNLAYFDLKHHPELLDSVAEVVRFPELRAALAALNGSMSAIETAKCDAWCDNDISTAEEIYGGSSRFGSYIDVLFSDNRRFAFEPHEALVKNGARLVANGDFDDNASDAAAAEFVVRRSRFHDGNPTPVEEDESHLNWRSGFYMTLYVVGYGANDKDARKNWAAALDISAKATIRASAPEP
jgi:hypothetical protein